MSLLVIGLALGGCDQLPAHPPRTVSQYAQHRRSGSQEYTPHTIALHNTDRVLNDSLSASERIESLRVLEHVDTVDEQICPNLATVLTSQSAPAPVRQAVLAFLAERDMPGLAEYVSEMLPRVGDVRLRATLLEWLRKHPSRASLAPIVKLWAAEKPISDENEARYRLLVERISGKRWSEALLEGLNKKSFFARGSAIEILASRLGPARLRRRVSAMKPQTQAVRVLKYFSDHFGYVPGTRRELLASVMLYRRGVSHLTPAERIANQWQNKYDYCFNIRHYHLLSRLAADPLRKSLSRMQMIIEISGGIARRRRAGPVMPAGAKGGQRRIFRRGRLVNFDSQTDGLMIADLWNLMLIGEMLDRGRFRSALKITADQDRADTDSRRGGLIKYDQGKAEALLYRPEAKQGDDQYLPTRRMLNDAIDCLCYFVGHFSKDIVNTSRIGPGEKELAFAAKYNVCGVVFTTIAGGRMNATYFTPEGIVIDLGEFRE